MNKEFSTPGAGDDDQDESPDPAFRLPPGTRNYITPGGHARIRSELEHLLRVERPQVVGVVQWAASNGDRSENGDYIYGKRRLREIDRRIRHLMKRLDTVEVVDHQGQQHEQVFFGATVTIATSRGWKTPIRSSASTRPTRRAGASAGCRPWRARCSRRARAIRYVSIARLAGVRSKSSPSTTGASRNKPDGA